MSNKLVKLKHLHSSFGVADLTGSLPDTMFPKYLLFGVHFIYKWGKLPLIIVITAGVPGGLVRGPRAYPYKFRGFKTQRVHAPKGLPLEYKK